MITYQVDTTGSASEELKQLIESLTGPQLAGLNEVGGRAAASAAERYHREFDRSGGWRKSGGGGSRFGSEVASGWHFRLSDATGATIGNDASHFGHKVRGGTIKPKRAQFLTIPLIPEAKGLRVETYVQNTGKRLFTIPGRRALFERGGRNGESLVNATKGRNKDGSVEALPARTGIRAVYALVREVTQPPWPGALPPEEVLTSAYAEAWNEGLADLIERLTR